MKRFFVFVFAVTAGILFFLAAIGGGWWYYESRDPNLTAEFSGFMDIEREGEIRWLLVFDITNNDSKDYIPGEWKLLRMDEDGTIFPFKNKIVTMENNFLYANNTTMALLLTAMTMPKPLFDAPDDIKTAPTQEAAEKYLDNLMRFRATFGENPYVLVNDKLGVRQQISFDRYYSDQLARRNLILEKGKASSATKDE